MSTEATQNTGADVIDLENLFAAEDTQDGTSEGAQGQEAGDTDQHQVEVQVEVDENGNPIESENANDDPDLELELEADPNAEQPTEIVIPDDHKVTLNIAGKDVEFTFADLKANAQKYEGANQKFEEAAAIRKEYTEKAQNLGTREQQLAQVLNYYIQQSNEIMQSTQPDWEKLIAEDPQKYLIERHNWEHKQRQLADARQVQANLAAQQQRDAQAVASQRASEARGNLIKAIPEFADPQKLAAGARAIDEYLAKSGISNEMRSAIDSAEVLVIARKAMLYDQAIARQQTARMAGGARGQAANGQTAQPQAQQRQQQRQAVRVERPGAARSAAQTAASRQNIDRVNQNKRFEANPSVDTLAGFFE